MKHWIADCTRSGLYWAVAAAAALAIVYAAVYAALLWSAPPLDLGLLSNPDALLPQRDQVGIPADGRADEMAPACATQNPGR